VADLFDSLEGLIFLVGAGRVGLFGFEVAVDELDGFEDAAGRNALPNLAEATGSEGFDESITWDRLGVGLS
jgi:hypothetical protein